MPIRLRPTGIQRRMVHLDDGGDNRLFVEGVGASPSEGET